MTITPAAFVKVASKPLETPWYPARVDRIHDGDTFLAQVSLGVDEYPMKWIRLYNFLAPELTEPRGTEATAALMTGVSESSLLWVQPLYRSFERWVSVVRYFAKKTKNLPEQRGDLITERLYTLHRDPDDESRSLFKQKGPWEPANQRQITVAQRRDLDELLTRRSVT